MPAKPTGTSEPWSRAIDDYAEQSRRPLAALAFVLPLLALYEAGVLLLGPQAVRNGADVWLRQSLDQLGFGQYFLLPVMTIGMLLAWHHVAQDRWQLSVVVLYVMFAECAVLGLGLVGVGRLQAVVMHNWHSGQGAFVAAVPWTMAGRSASGGTGLGICRRRRL